MSASRSSGLIAVVSAVWLGLIAQPALAKDHGHGKGPKHEKGRAAIVVDRDGHRRVAHEFFTTESLPPGLAKRESLPPGLRKQLRERGHLPPGLQKRLTPVPTVLAGRLPALPPYYHRYFAGPDLIVVDNRSHRIVAVIRDVR